jgi:hypothetical protein
MPDEFSPDLGGLEPDYQIQTELRHSRRSRTFLARHLGLNRDVTIQVLGTPGNSNDNSLTLFASDARTLSVIRHPNVVPVLEARWLAGGAFAVVRPRVRGMVIDEIVATEGPLAASRVAAALGQVTSAVAWARDNGIVHRGLSGDSVRFQQGSGRVLVEMDFVPLGPGGGVPDAYDDARTIGQLAFEMLAGRRVNDATGVPLAELRPDLPSRVFRELSTAMNADRRAASADPNILIGYLVAVSDASFIARPPSRDESTRGAADASVEAPVARPPDMPDKGRLGFGARLVILAIISTAIGAAGTLIYRREPSAPAPQPVTKDTQSTSAAGEVARRKRAPPPPGTPPPQAMGAHPLAPADTPPPKPKRPLVEAPPTRFHEPLRGAPRFKLPGPAKPSKPDSSKPAETNSVSPPGATSVVNACESTDA